MNNLTTSVYSYVKYILVLITIHKAIKKVHKFHTVLEVLYVLLCCQFSYLSSCLVSLLSHCPAWIRDLPSSVHQWVLDMVLKLPSCIFLHGIEVKGVNRKNLFHLFHPAWAVKSEVSHKFQPSSHSLSPGSRALYWEGVGVARYSPTG